MLLRVVPGALADALVALLEEEDETVAVTGKVEPGVGVVLAVKPGGGGGRVELVELLVEVEVAVEPDTDESE